MWWPALAALLAWRRRFKSVRICTTMSVILSGADTAERPTAARNRAGVAVGACRATRCTRGVCAGIADGGGARGVGRLADFIDWYCLVDLRLGVYRWALADRVFTAGRIVCADVLAWQLWAGRIIYRLFRCRCGATRRCHARLVCRRGHHGEQYARYSDRCAVVQKRTLAVRLGRSAMNTVYALELLLPFVLLPWFAVQTNLAWRMTWPGDRGRTGRCALSTVLCARYLMRCSRRPPSCNGFLRY